MLPDTAMRKWKVTLFEGSTGTKACLKGGILYFYTWYLGLDQCAMLRNGAQFSGASSLYQLSSSKERSEPMA